MDIPRLLLTSNILREKFIYIIGISALTLTPYFPDPIFPLEATLIQEVPS
jgi:hypothetical protein